MVKMFRKELTLDIHGVDNQVPGLSQLSSPQPQHTKQGKDET